MSEAVQIVRKMRAGEYLPAYPTHLLLMGALVTPPKDVPCAVSREEAAARFKERYDLVKTMLARFETNAEIARVIGVKLTFMRENIRSTEELIRLSNARMVEKCRKCGEAGAKQSRDRFDEKKDEILCAMETTAMYKVAEQFGFSHRTLRRYVKEAKEERS